MNYYEFLARKQVRTTRSGFESDISNTYAFEWQKAIVKQTLRQGKFALFEDCGLGKGNVTEVNTKRIKLKLDGLSPIEYRLKAA
ncbi:MAG: hypothetical protein K2J73_02230 [Oscillospiraceae bacterium]|nr:hypothetical protein [Oscillospiraceae bacterium]